MKTANNQLIKNVRSFVIVIIIINIGYCFVMNVIYLVAMFLYITSHYHL